MDSTGFFSDCPHCKGQKGYMPIAHNLNRPWLGQSKVVHSDLDHI